MAVFAKISNEISCFDINSISNKRKLLLDEFANYLRDKIIADQEIRLNFICTHNSRRSLFSQVWAQVMAHHFGISKLQCYSAGTEATALFPMVVKTLENSGLRIEVLAQSSNPIYSIKYAENAHPIVGFSKTLDDNFNPKSNFLALMTCSQANEDCPFISGAEKRISLNFDDPKVYDNTDLQIEKYRERSLQIALEMFYVFSQLKSR